MVAALDGLMLIGGGDIDAARYGQPTDDHNGGINRARDDVEMAILSVALDRDLPVLAICRGHQVLNVVLGGDLVQYLPDVIGTTDHQPGPGAFGSLAITTEPGSTVHRLLGGRIDALCCHHQAIGALGCGLVATARSGDGVIEAVELPGHRFVVGVQWHPEEMGDPQLFEALVEASRLHERQSPE